MIEPKLKSYFESIFTDSSCISNYSYEIKPLRTAYTISAQVRFGVRYAKEWVVKQKIARDIFEIEFEVSLNTTSKENVSSQGNLLVRMQFNAVRKLLQINASPMLRMDSCPDILVVEEICGCLNK